MSSLAPPPHYYVCYSCCSWNRVELLTRCCVATVACHCLLLVFCCCFAAVGFLLLLCAAAAAVAAAAWWSAAAIAAPACPAAAHTLPTFRPPFVKLYIENMILNRLDSPALALLLTCLFQELFLLVRSSASQSWFCFHRGKVPCCRSSWSADSVGVRVKTSWRTWNSGADRQLDQTSLKLGTNTAVN